MLDSNARQNVQTEGCIPLQISSNFKTSPGEVQFSTVDAVLLDASRTNKFDTFHLENCINKGFRTVNDSYDTLLSHPHLENSGAITNVVDAVSGRGFVVEGGIIAGGNVKFATAGCALYSVDMVSGTTLETTGGASGFVKTNSEPNGGWTNSSPTINDMGLNGVTTSDVNAAAVRLSASNPDAAKLAASDSTAVAGVATSIFFGTLLGTANPGNLVNVTGSLSTDEANTQFMDLVLFMGNGGTPTVVASQTRGSPAARTYSVSGQNLRLLMATGTYNVSAAGLGVRGN